MQNDESKIERLKLSDKNTINPEASLRNELALLEQKCGQKAKSVACQNLAVVARWVRESGHGSITLNAIDHIFSEKIKTETYIKTAVS